MPRWSCSELHGYLLGCPCTASPVSLEMSVHANSYDPLPPYTLLPLSTSCHGKADNSYQWMDFRQREGFAWFYMIKPLLITGVGMLQNIFHTCALILVPEYKKWDYTTWYNLYVVVYMNTSWLNFYVRPQVLSTVILDEGESGVGDFDFFSQSNMEQLSALDFISCMYCITQAALVLSLIKRGHTFDLLLDVKWRTL